MTDLVAAVDQVVEQLSTLQYDEDNKLRVVTRLEHIAPPCVWVALESIDHMSSAGEVLLRLFLVSPAVDEYQALKILGPLLEKVLTVISPTEATTVVGLSPTATLRDLAALRVTTSLVL